MDTITRHEPAVADAAFFPAVLAKVRRKRLPLPTHDLSGANFRRWSSAVLRAECDHADRSTGRQYGEESATMWLPHEILASRAANVLGHLIGHETEIRKLAQRLRAQRKASADGNQSAVYRSGWASRAEGTVADLRMHIGRRQMVWGIYLKAVAAYKASRSDFDAAAAKITGRV